MKLREAAGKLATLDYLDYDLKELTDIGKSIDNFKKTTLDVIEPVKPYDSTDNSLQNLSKMKICIKYQRKMRLKLLLEKIKKENGFNKEAAGHIDVAIRPNGDMYIWDGFRRAFMASLVGLEFIPASVYRHPANRTEKQCEEYEAKMFKIRNADTENMKQEEIFRSKIIYRDPAALKFLDFLRECKVDVEGLNPGNKSLGAFVQLHSSWLNGSINEDNLIVASRILQNSWRTDSNISGYLICGLGMFMDVNDTQDESCSEAEVEEFFQDYINVMPPKKQESLIKHRLSGLANESIAYSIAVNVMKLKGKSLESFANGLQLEKDDVEFLASMA
jgi:hypothetical protein